MKTITGLLAAVALAVGGTLFAGGAAASTTEVSAGQPAAKKCSTWQYKVTSKTGVYSPAGFKRTHIAYKGYYVNSRDRFVIPGPNDTLFKYGNVYNHRKQPVASGFVMFSKLDYVNCW